MNITLHTIHPIFHPGPECSFLSSTSLSASCNFVYPILYPILYLILMQGRQRRDDDVGRAGVAA